MALTIVSRSRDKRFGRITEAKVERWYGHEVMDSLKFAASGCYVPTPVMGAPVALMQGEFVQRERAPWQEVARRQLHRLRTNERGGFASLSDLIAEATAGKSQTLPFNQAGTTAVVGVSNDTWGVGPIPTAGAAGAAPPGGTVPTRATTGALGQQNPSGGDTLHLARMDGVMTVAGSIMLFDKLFATTTAANPGTGSISVTGVQNRYTGAAGTDTHPGGVVISNRVTVALAATAHNLTYGYTDQDNNAGASSGATAGRASAAVNQVDFAAGVWAAPLAGGDSGVRQLTSITFSASPATGQVEHKLMKPLGILPTPVANVGFVLDGINSAFNLIRIMDDAALTFRQFFATATTATTMAGMIHLVAG